MPGLSGEWKQMKPEKVNELKKEISKINHLKCLV